MKDNNLLKDRAWIEISLDNLVNNINEINKPGNTFIPKRYRPDITPSHTGTDNAEKINRSNNSMLIIRPL